MFVKKKLIDNVGILTIDNQSSLNALNYEVLKDLKKTTLSLLNDINVHSIVLTGAGEKALLLS